MKIAFIFIFILIFSCSKKEEPAILPVSEVVNMCAGTYNCMRVNFSWSVVQPEITDTVYNQSLTVDRLNDSTLVINNANLSYSGFSYDEYHFRRIDAGGPGKGHVFNMSKNFDKFKYNYEAGGLGGGGGYRYFWKK